MDSVCVLRRGVPRRRKLGVGLTGATVLTLVSSMGTYTACADPWLSDTVFFHHRAVVFFIKISWSYSTSPSQERLARRLFSCRVMGAEAPGVRGVLSAAAPMLQPSPGQRTSIYMKLRETSTAEDKGTTPVGRASIWSHL